MSQAATAAVTTDKTYAIDYDERTRIIITGYGVAKTSERRLYSYETVRYSYHVERTKDGKLARSNECGGFKSWEDALSDAQWYGIND